MRLALVLVCGLLGICSTHTAQAQVRGRGQSGTAGRQAAAAAGARMGAQLNATRNRMRAAEKALVNSPEYKAKKLRAAERAAENKADIKAEHDRFEASKYAHAPRLTPEQLDPETGEVAWPRILRGNSYAEHRLVLESLLTRRAKSETPVEGFGADLKSHVEKMQALLKQEIGSAKANDYASGRRFLYSLAEEAHQPPRPGEPSQSASEQRTE